MLNSEKGSVLIVALVLMMGTLLLLGGIKPPDVENNEYGFGYLQMLLSDFYETHRNYLRTVAINLAEAGIDRAIDKLKDNWVSFSTEYYDVVNEAVISYADLTNSQRNTDKRFWVCGYKATISGNDADITGIGYVKEMFTGSEFRFNVSRKTTISSTRSVPEAFNYGVYTFSNLGLEIKNNITVNAYCHSNGDLEIKEGATVNGNVQAVGTAEANPEESVSGDTNSGVDAIPLPIIDFDYYKDNGTILTSIPEDANLSGIIYVNGDVEIEGNVTLNGVIVATGKIEVKEDATLTHTKMTNYPALMSETGDIELGGTVTLESFIYTANTEPDKGKIELKGTVNITGSIISAGSLEIKDTATVTVDSGSIEFPPGIEADPELTSTWKEELLTGSEKL